MEIACQVPHETKFSLPATDWNQTLDCHVEHNSLVKYRSRISNKHAGKRRTSSNFAEWDFTK